MEDWLIDLYSEVKLPTQPHPESSTSSRLSLLRHWFCPAWKLSLNYMDLTLPPLIPSSFPVSPSPKSSASPQAPPLLYAPSPSPSPVTPLHDVKPPVVHSPAVPKRENPSSPPPASDPFAPPQPVNLSALPWLLPSPCLRCRLKSHPMCCVSPPLRLQETLPSLRTNLGPRAHRLRLIP